MAVRVDLGQIDQSNRPVDDEDRLGRLERLSAAHEEALPAAERLYDECCAEVEAAQRPYDEARTVLGAVLREREKFRGSLQNNDVFGMQSSTDTLSTETKLRLHALDDAEAAAREALGDARRALEAALSRRGDAGQRRDVHRRVILGCNSDAAATRLRIYAIAARQRPTTDKTLLGQIRSRLFGGKD